MRVEDLPIDHAVRSRLREMGIERLYPPQAQAIEAGLLDGESLLVSTPTASGKTLLAVLAAAKALEKGYKTLYLSPLRALTSEKAEYFKRILEPLDVKVAAVSRDYDSPEEWLKNMDVIIATYEKADSCVRHRSSWLKDVGLIVVDEVHLLADEERGPRLEVAATALMKIASGAQRLGLSATVTNYEEVAGWLRAKPLLSNWRPTELRECVYYDGRLYYLNSGKLESEEVKVVGNPMIGLTINCILDGGQAMIYAHSRRTSESYAQKMAEIVGALAIDREGLRRDAEMIRAEGRGLEMAENLASCVERGVAFHHAGLTYQFRKIVEEGFLQRRLKVICATPTLAAGVNIPARMVIIPEAKKSVRDMSVMEYKQLAGRAGRPGFDRVGYSVIIATSKRRLTTYVRRYLSGEPEPIKSNLLRRVSWAILASMSSGLVESEADLEDFMASTLLKIQGLYDPGLVHQELDFLRRIGIIEPDSLTLTRLGRRIAELCVDPITAILAKRISSVKALEEDIALIAVSASPDISPISYEVPLHMIDSFTSALERLGWSAEGREMEIIGKAFALKLWVNEVSEETISNAYGIAPGDLLILKENAEWVSSAIAELLLVLRNHKHALYFMELSERIRHGVKPELLQLCSIEGVGRVRARMLYNSGLRTVEDVAKAPLEKLMEIPRIGKDLAYRIKNSARILAGLGGEAA
jgi:helicase